MSSPTSSASAGARRPTVARMMVNMMTDATTYEDGNSHNTDDLGDKLAHRPPPCSRPISAAKMPTASVPHTPQNPCTDTAPTTSSISKRSRVFTPIYMIIPPIAPMMMASPGVTKAVGAVIATRPGQRAVETPGKLWLAHKVPAHNHGRERACCRSDIGGDRDERDTHAASESSWLPGLKPNQPSQRINVPSAASVML